MQLGKLDGCQADQRLNCKTPAIGTEQYQRDTGKKQNENSTCQYEVAPPAGIEGGDKLEDESNSRAQNIAHAEQAQSSEFAGKVLPITIAEWPRNAREVVRVVLEEYRTSKVITIRTWYRNSSNGELRPGKSGLSLSVKHLPVLAEAMSRALCAAHDVGLIDISNGGD